MNAVMLMGATMSSREIADLVELRHDNVKRTIVSLAAKDVIQLPQSEEVKNHLGQVVTEYRIGKRDSYIIVAQLSPEFTARLVDRWQELESSNVIKVPTTLSEALRLAADQADEIDRQKLVIAEQAPKAEFHDKYAVSTGNKGFREVCKLIKANEREFREFLIANDIMYRLAGALTPKANHLDAGRFQVKAGVDDESGHAFNQAKFTPKGVTWIAGEWAKYNLTRVEAAIEDGSH